MYLQLKELTSILKKNKVMTYQERLEAAIKSYKRSILMQR